MLKLHREIRDAMTCSKCHGLKTATATGVFCEPCNGGIETYGSIGIRLTKSQYAEDVRKLIEMRYPERCVS